MSWIALYQKNTKMVRKIGKSIFCMDLCLFYGVSPGQIRSLNLNEEKLLISVGHWALALRSLKIWYINEGFSYFLFHTFGLSWIVIDRKNDMDHLVSIHQTQLVIVVYGDK